MKISLLTFFKKKQKTWEKEELNSAKAGRNGEPGAVPYLLHSAGANSFLLLDWGGGQRLENCFYFIPYFYAVLASPRERSHNFAPEL